MSFRSRFHHVRRNAWLHAPPAVVRLVQDSAAISRARRMFATRVPRRCRTHITRMPRERLTNPAPITQKEWNGATAVPLLAHCSRMASTTHVDARSRASYSAESSSESSSASSRYFSSISSSEYSSASRNATMKLGAGPM